MGKIVSINLFPKSLRRFWCRLRIRWQVGFRGRVASLFRHSELKKTYTNLIKLVLVASIAILLGFIIYDIGEIVFYLLRVPRGYYYGLASFAGGFAIHLLLIWAKRTLQKEYKETVGVELRRKIVVLVSGLRKSVILPFLLASLAVLICSRVSVSCLVKKECRNVLMTIGLAPIEDYLLKEAREAPRFFRLTGPIWADFENNYMPKMPIIDRIIDSLPKGHVFVGGEMSYETSVCLRMVGYHLAKRGLTVYVLPLQVLNRIENRDEFARRIKQVGAYLLLEEIHHDKGLGEYLYRKLDSKVLFVGKPPHRDDLRLEINRQLANGIELIVPLKSRREMIRRLEETNGCIFADSIRDSLLYMESFMIFSLQLAAHSNDSTEIIQLKSTALYLKDYINQFRRRNIHTAAEIFLPIALLYRYEIPVRRDYLEYDLQVDRDALFRLTEIEREILPIKSEKNIYLRLHSPEVAEVLVGCYKEFDELAYRVKSALTYEDMDWEKGSICKYLEARPKEGHEVIASLPWNLLCSLAEVETFPSILQCVFESSEHYYVGAYHQYSRLAYAFPAVFDQVDMINPELFERKMRQWNQLEVIRYFLWTMEKIDYSQAESLLAGIEPSFFRRIIESGSDDICSSTHLLAILGRLNYSRLDALFGILEPSFFIESLANAHSFVAFDFSLICLVEDAQYAQSRELLEMLEPAVLLNIVADGDNPSAFAALLRRLKRLNYPAMNDFLDQLQPDMVVNVVDNAFRDRGLYDFEIARRKKDFVASDSILTGIIEHRREIAQLIEESMPPVRMFRHALDDPAYSIMHSLTLLRFATNELIETLEALDYPQMTELKKLIHGDD